MFFVALMGHFVSRIITEGNEEKGNYLTVK